MQIHTSKIKEDAICPECKSRDLKKDSNRAELFCRNCGLVIDEDLIDYGPEWRAFDSEQRKNRAHTGAPMNPLLHDKGLSTEISWKNRDYYGNKIPNKSKAQLYRIRKWHQRFRHQDSLKHNISLAFREIIRLSSRLGLPRTIREQAARLYRKAAEKQLVRGRSIESVAAATVYAACRQCNVPRTLDEITAETTYSRKVIGRSYRHIARELKLNLNTTKPTDYLARFCNQLHLGEAVLSTARDILKKAADKEITNGKGPTGLAAAAIYISTILMNARRTQKEIADVANVTEVTIRNRYKEISEDLDIDISPYQ